MSRAPKLMTELDAAASALLKRHFPEPGAAPTDAQEQIKAFAAVVTYYGPRTKLGGDEEEKGSEYQRLKDRLHGRGKARGRSSNGAAQGGTDASGSTADDPAGTA